jgi:hypothetical protein
MKDCTTWLRDELLNHLHTGRYSVEQITEALQETLDTIRDPEESNGDETPMTQERLDAIWAKHEARLKADLNDDLDDDQVDDIVAGSHADFHEEIDRHGGHWMMWDPKLSGEEVAEMFVEMLKDRGCVVLKHPIAEVLSELGYVVFWPDQMPRADTSHEDDEAPATLPMTGK